MLLTLVIILVLIWSAVIGSLYSNFLVFYENFNETENYHKARYASIAAIERAELVIKQREPWYVWSWWRIWSEDQPWSEADIMPAWTSFSYLSKDAQGKSTVFWNINSKTNRIPSPWNGNVEKLLAAEDSPNYNMMDYENAEIFLLYFDNSEIGQPYDKKNCPGDCIQSSLDEIVGAVRLPSYIKENFWDLDVEHSLMTTWSYTDDALVDWQLKWTFLPIGSATAEQFTIFATQNAAWLAPSWAHGNDSTIRESDLNEEDWVELIFNEDSWNPKKSDTTPPTIISPKDKDIINFVEDERFSNILTNPRFSQKQLKFSLLNLVLWWWSLGKRYPFLEYYVDFWNTVSDKYFTIETEWNFWDYKIDNILFRPTITESILKSFTTIL